MKRYGIASLALGVMGYGWLTGCSSEKPSPDQLKPYEGAVVEVDTVQTLYTDSARVQVKMNAPKQLELKNGDQVLPKGVSLVFYDKLEQVNGTLRGNRGVFSRLKNLYTVTGNVVVITAKGETVNTEELNWSPATHKIFTDKMVTILTKNELIKGQGLDAEQDFSRMKLRKPEGIFDVSKTQPNP